MVVVSFIGGGNRSSQRKQLTCRKSLTMRMLHRVQLTNLVVIGTDCTGSVKFKYH